SMMRAKVPRPLANGRCWSCTCPMPSRLTVTAKPFLAKNSASEGVTSVPLVVIQIHRVAHRGSHLKWLCSSPAVKHKRRTSPWWRTFRGEDRRANLPCRGCLQVRRKRRLHLEVQLKATAIELLNNIIGVMRRHPTK